MKTNLKQLFTFVLLFTFFSGLNAQNSYWHKISKGDVQKNAKITRNTTPHRYEVYQLDIQQFKQQLKEAPMREQITGKSSLVMEFPNANGGMEKYQVTESPIMPAGLSSRFPQIKTYSAVGIDDPTSTMRFSVTPAGIHVMSLSGKSGQGFIDPYTKDLNNYIVYKKGELSEELREFKCYVDDGVMGGKFTNETGANIEFNNTDDGILRKYRLALSAHPDYGDVFSKNSEEGEEVADILAQMVIALNRVNEIYERELGITMELVENNDQLIFYSDMENNPWEGYDSYYDYLYGGFNDRTQFINDSIIGTENYDIGHNFNTSGGGNAGCIGCVCATGSKGSGYTGLPNPIGDAFYVDFVAHEMGHQFGGYHVMNTCSRSGSGLTEVEPASGSSIMGYAGVCDYNIQPHSDAHFNYVNIRDISANIQQGVSTCGEQIQIENKAPTADAGDNYYIPISTAYVLTGVGEDSDGVETLTYEWAQNDPQKAATNGPLNPSLKFGAIYRAHLPQDVPVRYFPPLENVVAGNLNPTSVWEVTPDVGRMINFSFTVRDNGSGYAQAIGQTASDLMRVTTVESAGPFVVTSFDATGQEALAGGQTEITWDVAGTDGGQVNVQAVDIILSDDAGKTFERILAENVPNSGSAMVQMPDEEIAKARVMVKARENIFYAVNKKDFKITADLSTEEFEMADNLSVYPNPNNGDFYLKLGIIESPIVEVQIFNLEGRRVYENSFQASNSFEQNIQMNQVQSGLYILRVRNGNKTINKKLIIR